MSERHDVGARLAQIIAGIPGAISESEALAAYDARRSPGPAPTPTPSVASVRAQRVAARRKIDKGAEPVTPRGMPRAARPRRFDPLPPAASRARARLARWTREADARGAPAFRPTDWTERAIVGARALMAGTRRDLEHAIAALPRCYARRVLRAALGTHDLDGVRRAAPLRTLTSCYARRTIALGWAIYVDAHETRRHGFARVLDGVSLGMLSALLGRNDDTGRPWAISTLNGTAINSSARGRGNVRALIDAGAVHAVQPSAAASPAQHVGPSGYALNQYWIGERAATDADDGTGAPLDLAIRPARPRAPEPHAGAPPGA